MNNELTKRGKAAFIALIWIVSYMMYIGIFTFMKDIKSSYALLNNSISISTGTFSVKQDCKEKQKNENSENFQNEEGDDDSGDLKGGGGER